MNQFLREAMFYGEDAVELLSKKHVMVFGIGGVGSYTAEALCRAGIGHITLVDNDTVGLTNLNRQLCALHSTLGQYKSDVMAARLRDINPEATIVSLPKLYDEAHKEEFFSLQPDYIVDAIDTVTAKIDLIVQANRYQVPIMSAMGAGNKMDPTAFEVDDIYNTSVCPLARVMRYELRKRGIPKLKVVYSKEKPVESKEDMAASCRSNCICPPGTARKCTQRRAIPGSNAFVPSVAGLIIAGEVVKDLIGWKPKK